MHDNVGKTVEKDKYVGDVVTNEGSNKENIRERTNKGYGIVNEILSILSEIPFGPYRNSVGLKLREAMLISGMMFNSEIWYNVKKEEVQKLSDVDEFLLQRILGVPSTTPKEALFLETGCIPIEYIMKMRRLMYLHHILRRPEQELIRKFYKAQKCKKSKGDWVQLVEQNLSELQIELDDIEISQMTKYKFKKMIRKKIQTAAFRFLMSKKETHSKMSENQYNKLETQTYLKSDSGLTDKQKQLLTNIHYKMFKLRHNYKKLYDNQFCELCKSNNEEQILS